MRAAVGMEDVEAAKGMLALMETEEEAAPAVVIRKSRTPTVRPARRFSSAPPSRALVIAPTPVPIALERQAEWQPDQATMVKRSIARLPEALARAGRLVRDEGRGEAAVVAKQFLVAMRYAAKAALVRKNLAKLVQGKGGTERFVLLDSEFRDPSGQREYLPGKAARYGPSEELAQHRLHMHECMGELPLQWRAQLRARVRVHSFFIHVYSTNKNNRTEGPKEQIEVRPIMKFMLVAGVAGYFLTDNQGRLNFVSNVSLGGEPFSFDAPGSTATTAGQPSFPAMPAPLSIAAGLPTPPVGLTPMATTPDSDSVPAPMATAPGFDSVATPVATAPDFDGVPAPMATAPDSDSVPAPMATAPDFDSVPAVAHRQRAVSKVVLAALGAADVKVAKMEAAAAAAADAAIAVLLTEEPGADGGFPTAALAAATAAALAAVTRVCEAAEANVSEAAAPPHEVTEVGQYLERLGLGRYRQKLHVAEIYTLQELSYWSAERLMVSARPTIPSRSRMTRFLDAQAICRPAQGTLGVAAGPATVIPAALVEEQRRESMLQAE